MGGYDLSSQTVTRVSNQIMFLFHLCHLDKAIRAITSFSMLLLLFSNQIYQLSLHFKVYFTPHIMTKKNYEYLRLITLTSTVLSQIKNHFLETQTIL